MSGATPGDGAGREDGVPTDPAVPAASSAPSDRRRAARGVPTGGRTAAGASASAAGHVRHALASWRTPRLRTGVAALLVAVASLGVLAGAVALWARVAVADTDAYVRIVAPVGRDPDVRAAVARYAAARAMQATGLEERLDAALPSRARFAAPALTLAVQRYLAAEIENFLATGLAQRLWVNGNRFAHERFVSALRDGDQSVTPGRGEVRLDLLPLVVVALQELGTEVPGILGEDVALPPIDPATSPGDTHTLLQDALGRELPADLASITLLHREWARRAERALGLLDALAVPIVVVMAGLAAAALLVSVRRRRTALWLGLGALLACAAARILEAQLERAAAGAVGSEAGAAVARAVVTAAIASLNGFIVWTAVAGAVVCVAALLAERPARLDAMGRGAAELFGVASGLSDPDTRGGRWIARHLDPLRVAGVGLALVTLPFASGSLAGVVAVVIALVVYELMLTAFAAGLPRGTGDASAGGPGAPTA